MPREAGREAQVITQELLALHCCKPAPAGTLNLTMAQPYGVHVTRHGSIAITSAPRVGVVHPSVRPGTRSRTPDPPAPRFASPPQEAAPSLAERVGPAVHVTRHGSIAISSAPYVQPAQSELRPAAAATSPRATRLAPRTLPPRDEDIFLARSRWLGPRGDGASRSTLAAHTHRASAAVRRANEQLDRHRPTAWLKTNSPPTSPASASPATMSPTSRALLAEAASAVAQTAERLASHDALLLQKKADEADEAGGAEGAEEAEETDSRSEGSEARGEAHEEVNDAATALLRDALTSAAAAHVADLDARAKAHEVELAAVRLHAHATQLAGDREIAQLRAALSAAESSAARQSEVNAAAAAQAEANTEAAARRGELDTAAVAAAVAAAAAEAEAEAANMEELQFR